MLEDRKLIYPTKRILMIAQLIAESDPVIEMALPMLEKLQKQSDETLILGKRQGDHVIYLEVLESANSIRYSARPGDKKPLHSSSIGKAMLSVLPDTEITKLMTKVGQPQITRSTISEPAELLENIRSGREQKAYITRGENVADVMAIAVPVHLGSEKFGIAIAGPMPRMIEKESDCLRYLKEAQDAFASLDRAAVFP
jgi:DNA-binding IclR family transcriptional regulator